MRVAIVNDLALAVEAIRRAVLSGPGHEVAWVAKDGRQAVEMCTRDRPELVLMDLIMPVMDGAEATRVIMRDTPCAVLVVTASVGGNAAKVFEAMGYGALDAVRTPVFEKGGTVLGASDLLGKMEIIQRLVRPDKFEAATHAHSPAAHSRPKPPMLAIGSSTGGPNALKSLLLAFPKGTGAALVVVQHVDLHFADRLAYWLRDETGHPVSTAKEGGAPLPDTVSVAATNDHLVLGHDATFHYTRDPLENPYRPSVDVFFRSVGAHWKRPGVAALLTGMGRDGAEGMRGLRRSGWHTIAQDAATSVVYGMPKAAAELDAACEVLPADRIGAAAWEALSRMK